MSGHANSQAFLLFSDSQPAKIEVQSQKAGQIVYVLEQNWGGKEMISRKPLMAKEKDYIFFK
jgi:hypothetical protein